MNENLWIALGSVFSAAAIAFFVAWLTGSSAQVHQIAQHFGIPIPSQSKQKLLHALWPSSLILAVLCFIFAAHTGSGTPSLGGTPAAGTPESRPATASSSPPSSSPGTATPTAQPETTYLADLPIVEQRIGEPGIATLSGSTFTHSIILDPNNSDEKSWATFDLGGHYSRFTATIGMLSDDYGANSLTWEIFINDQSVKKGTVDLYHQVTVDINITNAQRIRLASSLTGQFNPGGISQLKLAYGDATLSKGP